MPTIRTRTALAALFALTLALPAAAWPTDDEVRAAQRALKASAVAKPFLASAYGYALFPTVGRGAFAVGGAKAIRGAPRDLAFEEARGVTTRQAGEQAAVAGHRLDVVGPRDERTHDDRAVNVVRTQHGERIAVAAFDDRVDRAGRQRRCHRAGVQGMPGSAPQMSRA